MQELLALGLITLALWVGLCLIFALLRRLSPGANHHANAKTIGPISDEEFLALCTPGVNPGVALKVRRIVADNLGVNYETLRPSTSFSEDLGVY